MSLKKNLIGAAMVGSLPLGVLAPVPDADAAYTCSGKTVTQSGRTARYAYGNVAMDILYVRNNATAKAGVYNGRGVYVQAYAWNLSQTVSARSRNTTSTSYKSVANKVNYGAPTGGTWTGAAKVCVDVAWAIDPCGAQSQGRI